MKATIEPGGFVELQGRPWLVEEVQGELTDLQTLISDDAQGERLEILWDAEIGAVLLDEDGDGMSVPAYLIVRKC